MKKTSLKNLHLSVQSVKKNGKMGKDGERWGKETFL